MELDEKKSLESDERQFFYYSQMTTIETCKGLIYDTRHNTIQDFSVQSKQNIIPGRMLDNFSGLKPKGTDRLLQIAMDIKIKL